MGVTRDREGEGKRWGQGRGVGAINGGKERDGKGKRAFGE